MNKTLKIEDVKSPELGKFYMVPCTMLAPTRWVPIIGPWHEDVEDVGFVAHHYHRDMRFINQSEIFYPGQPCQDLQRVVTTAGPVAYRRMKMKREMPDFPTHDRKGMLVEFIGRLESRFKAHKLTCKVCPHRGMSLDGLPVKDGKVICNGHGLRWNVETGELAPRVESNQ